MSIPPAAVEHYKRVQRLQSVAMLAARRAWRGVDSQFLSESWDELLPTLGAAVATVQLASAEAGASYGAATMAAQGFYVAPQHFVDPRGFAGQSADGRSLSGSLYAAVPYTKNLIAGGMAPTDALRRGGSFLELKTKTEIADAGRGAAGIDVAVRNGVGYVRMLNPPSCSRCSVLAGKFYRWNAGFQRHPGCDCVHMPAKGAEAARTEGLIHDPYEYFHGLSEAEQDRLYTKAGAQAIRDGGDLFQVVNSRRGMSYGGVSADGTRRGQRVVGNATREGTSRRGNFGAGRAARLTPEGIYSQKLPKDETLRLLERNGYILPGGQNPQGVLRGQAEGFGQLGRGGTRVGSREAVLEARRTGLRDPNARATMTAAERRVFDAQANWDAVRKGRNPFTNAKGAKVTPDIAARVERDYRKHILGY